MTPPSSDRHAAETARPVRLLSIAGSDSGGGAGIQADLKTFAALGCYGMTAITALTAQNTCGVRAHPGAAARIAGAADRRGGRATSASTPSRSACCTTLEVVRVVAEAIRRHRFAHVVLDPVMVATSGDRLIAADTRGGAGARRCSRWRRWSRRTSTRPRCCSAARSTAAEQMAPAARATAGAGRAGRAAEGRPPAGADGLRLTCWREAGARAALAATNASPAATPTAPAARCRARSRATSRSATRCPTRWERRAATCAARCRPAPAGRSAPATARSTTATRRARRSGARSSPNPVDGRAPRPRRPPSRVRRLLSCRCEGQRGYSHARTRRLVSRRNARQSPSVQACAESGPRHGPRQAERRPGARHPGTASSSKPV